MKKAFYFLIAVAVSVAIGLPLISPAQDKDCPDCPKNAAPAGTPGTPSTLDPMWRQFVVPPLAPGQRPDCHRVQLGKQDCLECHKKETPAMYEQWLGSKHGINMVKCGNCHGDVANYRAMPDKVVCIGCHSAQVNQMPAGSAVTNCSYCHKSHWFTVHKIGQYEKFSPGREDRFKVPGF